MADANAPDDRRWSERLAAGDARSLEELYDAYAGAIYRQALSILDSAADAEDVLQEVFLKLVRRRGGPIRDLTAYLLTAARRESYSVLRRRAREQPCETCPERSRGIAEGAASAESPAAIADVVAVREAVAGLPAAQREVVRLKIYEQMTFEEIACAVKASANTVASRYRYALKKLRQALGDG